MNSHFKIFIPFYNVENWIVRTVRSVKGQDYKNFECILVNDMSTDKSLEILEKEIANDNRFKVICNTEKRYVIENMYTAFDLCKPNKEDIVVVLDGDDWFSRRNILSTLKETYDRENCWFTYGSYVEFPSMTVGKFAKQIPQEVIQSNSIRQYPWVTGHLQTFKYGLWESIDREKSFKEPTTPDKEYHFMYGWDLAWVIPLVELAGERAHYVSDILYVYNRENPLNCDKIKHQQQLLTEQTVRGMEKYEPLESL